jgi:hypothetical protein
MRGLRQLVFAGLISTPAAAAGLTQLHQYDIEIDEGLGWMKVQACFDGLAPEELRAATHQAARVLRRPRIMLDGETHVLTPRHNRLRLPAQPDDACLRYEVDLALASRSRNLGIASRTGGALVTSPRIWLWRPLGVGEFMDIELRFRLPEGADLSGPWRRLDGDAHHYRLGPAPLGWDASVIIGAFDRFQINNGAAIIDVAVADGPRNPPPLPLVRDWLERAAAASAELFGAFPRERAQVIVIPLHHANRPLVQARASRGGGPGLLLGMNARLPTSAFEHEPMAVHEFLHFSHPAVERAGAWLPEGIATYYKYIVMARAGQISEREAWRRMLEGMEDGRWDRRMGTLRDHALRMDREGGMNYVYWSGAAMLLRADVELRRRSGGEESLDVVLARWARCCFIGIKVTFFSSIFLSSSLGTSSPSTSFLASLICSSEPRTITCFFSSSVATDNLSSPGWPRKPVTVRGAPGWTGCIPRSLNIIKTWISRGLRCSRVKVSIF